MIFTNALEVKEMEDMTLDELDELEDEEEERVLEQYRQQRIAQIKTLQQKSRYILIKKTKNTLKLHKMYMTPSLNLYEKY